MQLGMIGLGRMGANMVRRLMRADHECVVYDVSPTRSSQLAGEGAVGASSLEDLVGQAGGAARRVADGARRPWSTRRSTAWSRCSRPATP